MNHPLTRMDNATIPVRTGRARRRPLFINRNVGRHHHPQPPVPAAAGHPIDGVEEGGGAAVAAVDVIGTLVGGWVGG